MSSTAFFRMYLPTAPRLQVIRHASSKLDKRVVQQRHTAFNRGRHAHLILLHQQLDEICLLIGVQHSAQQRSAGVRVPVAQIGCRKDDSVIECSAFCSAAENAE